MRVALATMVLPAVLVFLVSRAIVVIPAVLVMQEPLVPLELMDLPVPLAEPETAERPVPVVQVVPLAPLVREALLAPLDLVERRVSAEEREREA